MSTRYVIEESSAYIHPKVSGYAYQIAQVMDVELGSEPFSRKTIAGIIHLAAERKGIGKFIDINTEERIYSELISSGFLLQVEEK